MRVRFPERGQAIFPLVLTVVLILGLLVATLAAAAFLQTQLSGQRVFAEQARQAAQSGVNDALLRIVRDKSWPTSLPSTYSLAVSLPTVPPTTISTSVTVSDASTPSPPRVRRQIDASATVRNTMRKIRVVVEISPSGGVTILSREELTS